MKRKADWETKLHLFIEEKRHTPFKWGENDCCLFTCDWVAMVLGYDPGESFRGAYHTAYGATKVLKAHGGVEAIATGVLGQPDPAQYASRGDVVSCDTPTGRALGVCIGPVAAFVGERGLFFRPIAQCMSTWRI